MIRRQLNRLGVIAVALTGAVATTAAQADFVPLSNTYGFTRVTANGTENPEGQFTIEVRNYRESAPSEELIGQVSFKILNNEIFGWIASSITDVYFEDGTLLGIAEIVNGSGTSFTEPASPGNLPGGGNFEATADFSADSDPPIEANGINPGEWLEIIFDLKDLPIGAKYTYSDVLAAIAAGQEYTANPEGGRPDISLRFGLHVQAIGLGGESEGFINSIPLPAPFGLALAGLAGVVIISRRKRKISAPSLD